MAHSFSSGNAKGLPEPRSTPVAALFTDLYERGAENKTTITVDLDPAAQYPVTASTPALIDVLGTVELQDYPIILLEAPPSTPDF